MDIELILDVLNKHNIDNEVLATDLFELAHQSYLDGCFDENCWWMEQDLDENWINEHLEQSKVDSDLIKSIENNIKDIQDTLDLDKPLPEDDKHIPGLPIDRRKKDDDR